jgi:hypothetical protein
MTLDSSVSVVFKEGELYCVIAIEGRAPACASLVVSVRPYNPEGVSFISSILERDGGWVVNNNDIVEFDTIPSRMFYSIYRRGDVYHQVKSSEHVDGKQVECDVGMASAAAVYPLDASSSTSVTVTAPLGVGKELKKKKVSPPGRVENIWQRAVEPAAKLDIPDRRMKFLYDTALRTMLLFSSDEKILAGPFTYKRFWFRDAAIVAYAMICAGFAERARVIIDNFSSRCTPFGYFRSQNGEWDSNGQVLWVARQLMEKTSLQLDPHWRDIVKRAARWIEKKRLRKEKRGGYAGLMPAGFSAEHLGPNDFYYWDDFWSIAGLYAAADMLEEWREEDDAAHFRSEGDELFAAVERSVRVSNEHTGTVPQFPASPLRRMDSGAVGSLACSYPLHLVAPGDERAVNTVEYLLSHCMIDNAFFHDISHSGINPYLTLHIAQVCLRAGDMRYWELVRAIADLATSTGQWPEAIHPALKTGCMGDGQHVWAAAEWLLMIRSMFVHEERNGQTLILCSGIPEEWCVPGTRLSFGPAPTRYGTIIVTIEVKERKMTVAWEMKKRKGNSLHIDVAFPGRERLRVQDNKSFITIQRQK